MSQEGRPFSAAGSEGLHCTQGHFVPYFGSTTWFSIRGVKFCMQCIIERVAPFLDALGVGRVVKGKGDGVSRMPPSAHPPKYPRH